MPEPPNPLRVFIATPLEAEFAQQIADLDPRIELIYRPDYLARASTLAIISALRLSGLRNSRPSGRACFANAHVIWDFDRDRPSELLSMAPNLSIGIPHQLRVGGLAQSVRADRVRCAGHQCGRNPHDTDGRMGNVCHAVFREKHSTHSDKPAAALLGQALLSGQLDGATLALVGLGAVGSEIARRAHQFGMRVLAHRRRTDEPLSAGCAGR